jgi:hypothetical protein
LLVALLLAWFLGLRTAHEGYVVASIAVNPFTGDTLALPPPLRDAMVQSIADNAHSALPVGLAQTLTGALLVVVSAIALFRGRVSLSFMLQTLAANAVVAAVGYVFARPVRDAMVRVLAAAPDMLGADPGNLDAPTLTSLYRWAFHLSLAFQLAALLGLAVALTRPGARAFLAYTRPYEER